jgi:hypothetical protein
MPKGQEDASTSSTSFALRAIAAVDLTVESPVPLSLPLGKSDVAFVVTAATSKRASTAFTIVLLYF